MNLGVDKALYGEALTLAIGQAVSVAGALVSIRILTRVMKPDVYGQVALAMTVTTLVTMTAAGPVGNAVGRLYAPAIESRRLGELWRATKRFFLEMHAGVVLLGAAAITYMAFSADRKWAPIGLLVLVLSLVLCANAVLDCLQNAARQRVIVAWHQACGQWGRVLLAVALVRLWGPSGLNVLWGYLVASIIVLASQVTLWHSLLSRLSKLDEADDGRETRAFSAGMRTYGLPFAAWGVIAWLQQSSDRWVLATFTDIKQVGIYQIVYQLGFYPLTLLSNLVGQVAGPVFYGRAGDGSEPERLAPVRHLVRRLGLYSLLSTLALSTLAGLTHRLVFSLMVPREYRGESHLLPLIMLASGLFATGQILAFDALIQMSSKLLLLPKIGSALFAVCLNCVGAFTLGVTGVVYATVLSSAFYAAWTFALTLKPAGRSEQPVKEAELAL